MGISEQLSGPFNLSAVEGDSRILMGLFYQRAAGPCSGRRQGEREADRERERERGRERVCVCVRPIILTPPSDSTREVPCQMIQHRLLSFPLSVPLSSFPLCFFFSEYTVYLPSSNVRIRFFFFPVLADVLSPFFMKLMFGNITLSTHYIQRAILISCNSTFRESTSAE